MEFSRELLFFFSGLGAFNGLLMGCYFLFYAKPKHISNYFLGALLITMSTRIGKSVFLHFNNDLAGFYLQVGLTACFFIGPSLYFYLRSMLSSEKNVLANWKYHLAVLIPCILTINIIYPFDSHFRMWQSYFINFIYFEWFLYLIASAFLLRKTLLDFWSQKDKRNTVEFWLLSIFIGNAIIWIAYNTTYYTSYISGALSFSFIFYLLILLLIFNKKKDSILFKKQVKYADRKIADTEVNRLVNELEQLMTSEKLYKDSNLKLVDVAQKLNIPPHLLSQLINENLNKNFSLFLNEYRIKEAQALIKSNDQFTLEAIGYECGFNSKSTFYSTFKKQMGATPAQYKKNLV